MDHKRAVMGLAVQDPTFQPPPGAPLFEYLGEAEREYLSGMHSLQAIAAPEEHLVADGDTTPPVMTLLSGWAFRYGALPDGRRQILQLFLPGDTIGLEGLLECTPPFPVQCATSVLYGQIGFARACKLAGEADWFRRLASEAISRGRRAAEIGMVRLGRCRPEERLMLTLMDIRGRLEAVGQVTDGRFTLPLSDEQLSDLIGVAPGELRRVLAAMNRSGQICSDGQEFVLPDTLPNLLAAAPQMPVHVPLPTSVLV